MYSRINGTSSIMLFQENSRKEMLEKNLRRESAIFEGDEELLWSFKDSGIMDLKPLALAKLLNDNWFEKGSSSQAIVLSSFPLLQASYVKFSNNFDINYGLLIHPNERKSSEFTDYTFVLLAMHAWHALQPHNRKYYFNSFTSRFEPIYYDGNAEFALL